MTERSISLIAGAIVLALTAALLLALGVDPLFAVIALLGGAAAMLAVTLGGAAEEPVKSAPIEAPPPLRPLALHQHADFQPLLEALGDPVLLLGDGLVLGANGAAKALLGSFIVGADVRSAIRHPGAVDRLTRRALDDDAAVSLMGLGTPDQRWEMRDVALPGDQQLVLLADQTQRDAIDRMRADFVANASHELRTPLAAILGYVETLQDPDAGGDAAVRGRFLGIIDTEARRMQALVRDLLSMSRIESSKHQPPTDSVALGKLAATVIAQLQVNGDQRAAAITLTQSGEPPTINGDEAQLSQMLHNLLGNAMKYGRPDTPITLALGPVEAAMVTLSVADEGNGIAPEHLPRLTERFYRVDSARSRAIGGTGLGLAIVRHVVERHRGEMAISSEIGIGTTVVIRLPVGRN
jgi:two-component system, OmpR family, phosphate regulon sensor histidine kinase PhoR